MTHPQVVAAPQRECGGRTCDHDAAWASRCRSRSFAGCHACTHRSPIWVPRGPAGSVGPTRRLRMERPRRTRDSRPLGLCMALGGSSARLEGSSRLRTLPHNTARRTAEQAAPGIRTQCLDYIAERRSLTGGRDCPCSQGRARGSLLPPTVHPNRTSELHDSKGFLYCSSAICRKIVKLNDKEKERVPQSGAILAFQRWASSRPDLATRQGACDSLAQVT